MSLNHDQIIPAFKVEKIVYKGLGLGFFENSPVFVYQGLPGDDVKIRIVHKRGDVYFGTIISYNSRSPFQIPVSCEVFNECGGCEWLHVKYEDQLQFKQHIVEEFFTSPGHANNQIDKIELSPKVNFYRNKIFLPVSDSEDGLIAGIYARRSHKIVPHRRCLLQPEGSDHIVRLILQLLKKAKVSAYDEKRDQGTMKYIGLRYSEALNRYLVIFVTNTRKFPFFNTIVKSLTEEYPEISGVIQNINECSTNRILGTETKSGYGSEYLEERIGEVSYQTHYTSFFQVNSGQTKKILDFIKEQLTSDDTVIDAFSGIGTIGIYMADGVKEVIFLEEHHQSVKDCEENAQINNLANCRYFRGKVEDTIGRVMTKTNASTIIFDPPRKGIDKAVINNVIESKLSQVIYVSCDIATQKRDLELLQKGGFRIIKIRPFDMFPHTYHIENVAVLSR